MQIYGRCHRYDLIHVVAIQRIFLGQRLRLLDLHLHLGPLFCLSRPARQATLWVAHKARMAAVAVCAEVKDATWTIDAGGHLSSRLGLESLRVSHIVWYILFWRSDIIYGVGRWSVGSGGLRD